MPRCEQPAAAELSKRVKGGTRADDDGCAISLLRLEIRAPTCCLVTHTVSRECSPKAGVAAKMLGGKQNFHVKTQARLQESCPEQQRWPSDAACAKEASPPAPHAPLARDTWAPVAHARAHLVWRCTSASGAGREKSITQLRAATTAIAVGWEAVRAAGNQEHGPSTQDGPLFRCLDACAVGMDPRGRRCHGLRQDDACPARGDPSVYEEL